MFYYYLSKRLNVSTDKWGPSIKAKTLHRPPPVVSNQSNIIDDIPAPLFKWKGIWHLKLWKISKKHFATSWLCFDGFPSAASASFYYRHFYSSAAPWQLAGSWEGSLFEEQVKKKTNRNKGWEGTGMELSCSEREVKWQWRMDEILCRPEAFK